MVLTSPEKARNVCTTTVGTFVGTARSGDRNAYQLNCQAAATSKYHRSLHAHGRPCRYLAQSEKRRHTVFHRNHMHTANLRDVWKLYELGDTHSKCRRSRYRDRNPFRQ